MNQDIFEKIKSTVKQIILEYQNVMDTLSLEFLERVYSQNIGVYINRLKAIGFQNHKNVLDAGCGFGQWTIGLATLNRNVAASDLSVDKLIILDRIKKENNIKNISLAYAPLNKQPFADNSFDCIFCYGALFLSPWRQTLKEFTRLLKKNGMLYVNADGLGWYLHLWRNAPNKSWDYDPQEFAAHAMYNTYKYKKKLPFHQKFGLIIEPKELEVELEKNALRIIASGAEGTINLSPQQLSIAPFFRGSYEGLTGVFDVLARKQ